jgi:hypothetical protein
MADTGRHRKDPLSWPLAYASGPEKLKKMVVDERPPKMPPPIITMDFADIERRVLELELSTGPLSIYK